MLTLPSSPSAQASFRAGPRVVPLAQPGRSRPLSQDKRVVSARLRAATYRQLEQQMIRRLIAASSFDLAALTGMTLMTKLKFCHPDLWMQAFVDHRPGPEPDRNGSAQQQKRARQLRNDRVHRQRNRAFVKRVEDKLIALGRMLPEDEYSRPPFYRPKAATRKRLS